MSTGGGLEVCIHSGNTRAKYQARARSWLHGKPGGRRRVSERCAVRRHGGKSGCRDLRVGSLCTCGEGLMMAMAQARRGEGLRHSTAQERENTAESKQIPEIKLT